MLTVDDEHVFVEYTQARTGNIFPVTHSTSSSAFCQVCHAVSDCQTKYAQIMKAVCSTVNLGPCKQTDTARFRPKLFLSIMQT